MSRHVTFRAMEVSMTSTLWFVRGATGTRLARFATITATLLGACATQPETVTIQSPGATAASDHAQEHVDGCGIGGTGGCSRQGSRGFKHQQHEDVRSGGY